MNGDSDLLLKRERTANTIRELFPDDFSSIEDDSLLLTEYIYKFPQEFERTKHLLPEVTLNEIEAAKETAQTFEGVEPESAEDFTDVVGWDTAEFFRTLPTTFMNTLDGMSATGPDPFERKFIQPEEAFDIPRTEYDKEALITFGKRISDRDKEAKKATDEWYLDNPRAYAHKKYKEINSPNYWNPLSWDRTDLAHVMTTAVLEVGSQLGATALGLGPVYNYTRLFGSGISGRLNKLEKEGYSPDQAMEAAIGLSNISAIGQSVLESYIPHKLLNKNFGTNVIDKFGKSVANKLGKKLTAAGMGAGTKAGRVSDYILMTGADAISTGFQEGLTELGQFVFDKAVDRVKWDKEEGVLLGKVSLKGGAMDLLKQIGSQEAAQDFWGGFFGGGMPGAISAGVNNRALLSGKYHFEFNSPTGGVAQEKALDKHLAEYTAPDPETAEQAGALIDGIDEAKATMYGLPLKGVETEYKAGLKAKKFEKLTDQAIIAEMVLYGKDNQLHYKNRMRFNNLRNKALRDDVSQAEMLKNALEDNPKALEEAGIDPRIATDYYQEQNIPVEDMPEIIQEQIKLPEPVAIVEEPLEDITKADVGVAAPVDITEPVQPVDLDQLAEQVQFEPDALVQDVTAAKEKKEAAAKKKAPTEDIESLKEFGKKIVGAKSLKLIGSTARKGKGKDVDMLYDIGTFNIPENIEEGGPQETAEFFAEYNPVENFNPAHDNIFKFKDQHGNTRYFHIDPKDPESPAKEMGNQKVIDSIEADVASGVAIELKAKKKAPIAEDQTTLFQRPRKGVKALDNKKLARAMEKRLKKQLPWVKAKWVDEIYDEEGSEVAGRALTDAVEWSKGKATLDTIPHEYAHIYVRLMKDSPVIKEGVERFKSEEKLVQHIGDYYTGKMKNKGLISRMKTWLRKLAIAMKKFFKVALTDKEAGDIAAEQFFTAEAMEIPVNMPIQIDYQKLRSKDERTLFKAFDVAWRYSKKSSNNRLPAHVWINSIKKLIGNKEVIKSFDRWVSRREEQDIISWKKYNPSLKTDVPFEDANITESIAENTYTELLEEDVGSGVYNIDIRRGGNRLKYLPLYALKTVISTDDMNKLYRSTKLEKTGFDNWINNVQSAFTGIKAEGMTEYEKNLMTRYYLNAKQSISVHNSVGELPNDRNYMQLLINYPKQYGSRGIYKYRAISRGIGKFSKAGAEYPIARSSKESPFVVENQIDLTDLIWLSSKEFYTGKEDMVTVPSGRQFAYGYRPSYKFLSSNDIHNSSGKLKILGSTASVEVTPAFIRGDSMRYAFTPVKEEHKKRAGDISYWEEQHKNDFITGKQLEWQKTQMGNNKDFLAQEIAVFEIMNRIMPGYAAMPDALKAITRFKIPTTPVTKLENPVDEDYMVVDPETTKIKLGENDSFDMMIDIEGVGRKNRFDGATFRSKSAFNTYVRSGGLDPRSSTAKTVVYEISGDKPITPEDHLMQAIFGNMAIDSGVYAQKHLEFLADAGMQWLDKKGNVLAEVKDGDIYDADGNYLSAVQTPDEAKVMTGRYNVFNKPIRISGSSIGIIQYSDEVKSKGKMLRQQFNFIRDEKYKNAILEKMIDSGVMHRALTNGMKSIQTADGIRDLVVKLNKSFPDNISASYINLVNIGGGRHPSTVRVLTGLPTSDRAKYSGLVVGKIIFPAMNLDGNNGTTLKFKPDTSGQLKLLDARIPYKNAKFLRKRFLKENPDLNWNFENASKWIKKVKPDVIAGRAPQPHKNSAALLNIVDLIAGNRKNEVELNAVLTYKYFEADNDGDELHIVDIPDDMEKDTRDYYSGEEYTKDVHGISLEKYVDKKIKYDLLKREDRLRVYEAMGMSAQAEVAKIQAIYGILQDTLESIDMNEFGLVKLRSGDQVITVPELNNEKHTVDNMLRIYLQAAVDNGKFLLLSQWGYSRRSLIMKLFELGGKGLDQHDPYIGGAVLDVASPVLAHANDTYSIVSAQDNVGKFNLTQIVDKSIALKDAIELRGENWRSALDIETDDIFNIKYKDDALNLNEKIAVKVGEIFSNTDLRKVNTSEYHDHIYLDSHHTALELLKEKIDYEHKYPAAQYANSLVHAVKDYFKVVDRADVGKRRKPRAGKPAFPDIWDTSPSLVSSMEVSASKFNLLSDRLKILATYEFLEKYGRLVNDNDGVSRLDLLPPLVDKTVHSVLDPSVVKIYFKDFDKALDTDYKHEDSKEKKCP